jgi:hypothetical protein
MQRFEKGKAMSLLSMASVAVARDHAQLGQVLSETAVVPQLAAAAVSGGPVGANAPAQSDGADETPAGGVAGFGQLLVAQIPGETLLAYTTLLALFAAGGGGYTTGRWVLYAATLVASAAVVLGAYFAKRDYSFDTTGTAEIAATPGAALHLPYMPVLAAVLSMAVYGLTVPGSPLQAELPGTTFAIVSGCLAVGGGVMMSIFAPFLGKGNAAKVAAHQP